MFSQSFIITNEEGLHLRPAAVVAKEMGRFKCSVAIIKKNHSNQRVNAKSLINIVGSCIKCGTEIVVEAEGEDEKAAVKRFEELLKSGFSI
ncbi:MAG: HPr family phosphocarrier protein [Lachnospiraceae bacterium]|nr:HPr family phosphocarrier protein [Lachnospiraceae bacterium]